MRVAAVQHDIVWEDPPANFTRLAPLLAEAADRGARLALLTEMFSTGFSMRTDRIAEPVDGPSTAFLVEQAETRSMWVGGSVPERPAGADKPANTFVLASPAGAVHRYRKIHPFTYSGEHERYDAGDAFTSVEVDGVRCALFVCYDLRFADEFWGLAGTTDCYLIPANWPASRREHWRALLRARAIENLAYVVGVNRVGTGGRLEYGGDSLVVDPAGEILADGEGSGETVLVADVDPAHVAATRARFPFLADRR